MIHPRKDDCGNVVKLKKPNTGSSMATWSEPTEIACVVPDGDMPTHVNGLAIAPWVDAPESIAGWEALACTMKIIEPPFESPAGYKKAAGVVLCEPDGRVWVVAPSNGYGGYTATFPKGGMDGKSAKATALVEAFEEAGLHVHLTKFLIDVKRTASYTRYYLAVRTGGNPAHMGWESQAVCLVPERLLADFVSHSHDQPILLALKVSNQAKSF